MSLRDRFGIDGAVAYTVLARCANIAGSAGTVLLISHLLSSVEQGYYYTLLSLVALQVVFELGFSFVVQQLAAHESVHLTFSSGGSVTGSAHAHARLAGALRLSLRWYTAAAIVMCLVVTPLGAYFFTRNDLSVAFRVAWAGPWYSAAVASACALWCLPFYAFLEGCGQVRDIAAMRLRQSIVSTVLAWSAFVLHRGLYAPTLLIVGQLIVGLFFLHGRRRIFLDLLLIAGEALSWRREVWPFQWQTAVSSFCSYFIVQAYIPLIFALRGPVDAGQMGMSLSISGYMTTLALAWISTKATPFAYLIARGEFDRLDCQFRSALVGSLSMFGIMAVLCVVGLSLLPLISPQLAARMLPMRLFALLVVAAGANLLSQGLAILLRCFKREPLLIQAPLVALLTLLLARLSIPFFGNAGAACSYCGATTVVGAPFAVILFLRIRRTYRAQSQSVECLATERTL